MIFENKNAGNVLFLILIAVALFAALTYAITNSSRSGGGNVGREQNRLVATQIIEYGAYVKSQVDRLRIAENIPPEQLDFRSRVFLSWGSGVPGGRVIRENANCLNDSCKVFATYGGPVIEKTFEDYAIIEGRTDPVSSSRSFSGHANVQRMRLINVGSDKDDIVMQILQLTEGVCREINDILNRPDTMLDNAENYASATGSGNYFNLDDPASSYLGNAVTEIQGTRSGCYRASYHFGYVFYQVLVER